VEKLYEKPILGVAVIYWRR